MTRGDHNFQFIRKGFSLLELVLVVVILSVLAAIAMPRYVDSMNFYRADLAAKRIAVDLAMARDNAWASGVRRVVTFDLATNQYQLPGIRSLERTTDEYVVSLSETPYHATIVSADFQGQRSVTFDAYGLPDRGGQVVIRAGSFQKTIVLDQNTGNAKVQ